MSCRWLLPAPLPDRMSRASGSASLRLGHHQITDQLVGRLANHSQPFHVAQYLAGEIRLAAQL